MEIVKLNCAACGAPISVSEDIEYLNCASCGSFLHIQRGEGYIALKLAEKVAQVVQESTQATQQVIQESSEKTKGEIRRLEISQAINALEMQISSIEGEVHAYRRAGKGKEKKFKRELTGLAIEKHKRMHKIRQLKKDMISISGVNPGQDPESILKQLESIRKELITLRQAPEYAPYISNNIKALENEQKQLIQTLHKIRLNNAKKKFKSSQLVIDNHADEETVLAQLQTLSSDIRALEGRRRTPEEDQVLSDFRYNQSILQTRAVELERRRIQSELRSKSHEALKGAHLSAVRIQLALVESDIALLESKRSTSVIQEKLNALKSQRSHLVRYIEKAKDSEEPIKPYHPPRFSLPPTPVIIAVSLIVLFCVGSTICTRLPSSSSANSTHAAALVTESPKSVTESTSEPTATLEPTQTPTLSSTPWPTPDLVEVENALSDPDLTITDLSAEGPEISLAVNSMLKAAQSPMERLRQSELLLYMAIYKIFDQFPDVSSVQVQINDNLGPVLKSKAARNSAYKFHKNAFSKPVEEIDVLILYTTAAIDRMFLQYESYEILDSGLADALYQPDLLSVKDELDGWLLADLAKYEIQDNRVILQLSVDYLAGFLQNSDKETIDKETLYDAKLQAMDAVYVLFTRFEWIEGVEVSSYYYGKKLASLSVDREHFDEIGAQVINKAVLTGKPEPVFEKLAVAQ